MAQRSTRKLGEAEEAIRTKIRSRVILVAAEIKEDLANSGPRIYLLWVGMAQPSTRKWGEAAIRTKIRHRVIIVVTEKNPNLIAYGREWHRLCEERVSS
jgi:hypothetical protein